MKLKTVRQPDGSVHGYRFDCPGCGDPHVIPTTGPHAWGFNGDVDRPTFTPSLLVRGVKNAWGPAFDATPTVATRSFAAAASSSWATAPTR